MKENGYEHMSATRNDWPRHRTRT